ncbi:MAG: hypothetical protein IPM97_12730 [Bdellovibrionaceae bacterium]|nr:hypothetical protein [Pseudobdellovibrionaceae bacterium]
MKTFGVLILVTLIFTGLNSLAQSEEDFVRNKMPNINQLRDKLKALTKIEMAFESQKHLNQSAKDSYIKAKRNREIYEEALEKRIKTTKALYQRSTEGQLDRHKAERAAAGAENRFKNMVNDDENKRLFFIERDEFDNGTFLENEGDKARIMALKERVARFQVFSSRYGRDGLLTLAGGEKELNELLRGGSFQEFKEDVDKQLDEIFAKKKLYPDLMKNVKRLDEQLLPNSIMTRIDDILDGKMKLVRPNDEPKTNRKAKGSSRLLRALPFVLIPGAVIANENQGPELSSSSQNPVNQKPLSEREGKVPIAKPLPGAR